MGWMKFAIFVSCLWGNAALANTPDAIGGERQELQTIQSWMSHLNTYVPSANVGTAGNADLSQPQVRQNVLRELYILESVFRGEDASVGSVANGSLVHLACDNAVCGGGEAGGCIKCSAGKR